MQTNSLIATVLFALIIFTNCEKEPLQLAEKEKEVELQDEIKVENGTLSFSSQSVFDNYLSELE